MEKVIFPDIIMASKVVFKIYRTEIEKIITSEVDDLQPRTPKRNHRNQVMDKRIIHKDVLVKLHKEEDEEI